MPTDGGWNGDRQVDLVDVGAYLAYADSNGLAGGVAGREHFVRPLQRAFDVDADGQLDTFDWYGLQGCYARTGGRCAELFDADGSGGVGQADVVAFEAEASGLFGGPSRPRWRRGLIASRYGNPFMWTGQRFDPTTGQYHFWARTYSPRLGRWMQRDPLEYVDGVSVYEYARGAPARFVDPVGLDCYEEAADQYSTEEGRRQSKDEYGNTGLLTPEERQRYEEDNTELEIAIGLIKTAITLARSAWEGFDFLSNAALGSLLLKAAANIGIRVVGSKILNKAGKEISEAVAAKLLKEEARRIAEKEGLNLSLDVFEYAAKHGIKRYADLKQITKGMKGLIQAHHLIPERFAKLLGQSVDDMLAIVLRDDEHRLFTNAWDEWYKRMGREEMEDVTKEQVLDMARLIYRNFPEILSALGL